MRAPRERDGHASRQDVQDCQDPMGARFCARHSGERYITCLMEFLFLPIDGRRTGAPHGTLLASPLAGSSMVHALSSQVLSHNMHNRTRSPASHQG